MTARDKRLPAGGRPARHVDDARPPAVAAEEQDDSIGASPGT